MAWDWVVGVGYGTSLVVPATGSLIVLLHAIPDFAAGPEEFAFEDQSERSLFLERVVGQVLVFRNPNADLPFTWRMMMLSVDYLTVAPLYPAGTAGGLYNQTLDANLSWWDERCYQPSDDAPTGFDHPYWSEVDNRPKRKFGAKWNLWPCLVLSNPSMSAARVVHRLRLGVKG